ncbi:MAG: hypothetical protein ACJAVV_001710 [Alphaproteobacteria bacterium]|jgi:hypothetical protein
MQKITSNIVVRAIAITCLFLFLNGCSMGSINDSDERSQQLSARTALLADSNFAISTMSPFPKGKKKLSDPAN